MMIGKMMPEKKQQEFGDESIFPCFLSALRLVVILQVSSCTVERVFSQMKYALDFCGNVYEDHLEVRMFARLMGT